LREDGAEPTLDIEESPPLPVLPKSGKLGVWVVVTSTAGAPSVRRPLAEGRAMPAAAAAQRDQVLGLQPVVKVGQSIVMELLDWAPRRHADEAGQGRRRRLAK